MNRPAQWEILLVQACAEGRREAQKELYENYRRKMFAVCMRYAKNRTTAEDLLQESFIRVFSNIGKFRGEGSLEGWIRRIVVNTSLEHIRKKPFLHTVTDGDYFERVDETAHARLGADELVQLIQKLPDGYRTVFNLFAVEGYSHREIGQMLGISEGTSKSQYARARILLQNRIKQMTLLKPSPRFVGAASV